MYYEADAGSHALFSAFTITLTSCYVFMKTNFLDEQKDVIYSDYTNYLDHTKTIRFFFFFFFFFFHILNLVKEVETNTQERVLFHKRAE